MFTVPLLQHDHSSINPVTPAFLAETQPDDDSGALMLLAIEIAIEGLEGDLRRLAGASQPSA